MTVLNYRALVAYDGTHYSGFQIQLDRPTIQGELETALRGLMQEAIRVHGAGRTDAGVHAHGQVISFRAAWRHGVDALERALNAVLPNDIAVRGIQEADERFHARFNASSRTYVYTVYVASIRAPLLERVAYRALKPLDVGAMAAAAARLEGEQDLAAFGQAPYGDNTVRTVCRAEWRLLDAPAGLGYDPELGSLLQFEIEANACLRGMVRRIVGTLLRVGERSLSPQGFGEILASCDISQAAPQAPAHGLCLWRVSYDAARRRRGY